MTTATTRATRPLRDNLLLRALIPYPSPQDAAEVCVQVVAGWLRERGRSGDYPAEVIGRLADELDPPVLAVPMDAA